MVFRRIKRRIVEDVVLAEQVAIIFGQRGTAKRDLIVRKKTRIAW